MIQRQYAREFFYDAAHLKKFCHGTLSHPFGLSLFTAIASAAKLIERRRRALRAAVPPLSQQ